MHYICDRLFLGFLEDWIEWAEVPERLSPTGIRYSTVSGLCSSFNRYLTHLGLCEMDSYDSYFFLGTVFEQEGLCATYPFNDHQRIYPYDSTKNKERISWVKHKINYLKNETEFF